MNKLSLLKRRYEKSKIAYFKSIDDIKSELENITGRSVVTNDFVGDGLGVAIDRDFELPTYVSFNDIEVVSKSRDLKPSDFDNTFL